MTTLVLVSLLLFLPLSRAKARAISSPIATTERGSGVLIWLERHPRPGNAHSRALVTARAKATVWLGLRLAGVAWLYRGDVSTRSPFGCIHSYEGRWNDDNPPQWGGLQEDLGFQGTYGREYMGVWGRANHWPIWAQVMAAYRAYHGYHGFKPRSYYPWPNTARMCGLI